MVEKPSMSEYGKKKDWFPLEGPPGPSEDEDRVGKIIVRMAREGGAWGPKHFRRQQQRSRSLLRGHGATLLSPLQRQK